MVVFSSKSTRDLKCFSIESEMLEVIGTLRLVPLKLSQGSIVRDIAKMNNTPLRTESVMLLIYLDYKRKVY